MPIDKSIWLQSSRPLSNTRFDKILDAVYLEQEKGNITLDISELIMTKSEISAAVDNLSRGHMPQTDGPVTVGYLESLDKYQLLNGYHRIVLAILSGRRTILAHVDGTVTWDQPPKDDIYIPVWSERFKGMDEFIELYLLKRL